MRNVVSQKLTRLEEAAILATAAAAAFNVLLWNVGVHLDDPAWWLPWVRLLFGVVSFAAFDLVLLAIVADQRAHGRSIFGSIAAIGAALLSAGVALHVARVVELDALHAGPALLLLLFAGHLSSVRGVRPEVTAAEQRATEAEQGRTLAEQEVARLRTLAEQSRTRAEQAAQEITYWRAEAEQRPALPEHTPDESTITIGGRAYSVRAVAEAFGVAPSTANTRLASVRGKE